MHVRRPARASGHTAMTASLDHIAISTRFDMDAAEDIFTRLGFTLTPRGHHSLGSINHLMMFTADYLELVGIPREDAAKRPEIANAPLGLNGLVFKTDDVDETFARLDALGMSGDPPKSFSRPVTLADGDTRDACFRTVTARADSFPAGRLYFCEHLTPELLWREEWQTHANGVTGFSELIIVTPTPGEEAAQLAKLLEASPGENDNGACKIRLDDGFRLVFLSPEGYAAQFGDAARDGGERSAFFGGLGLRCTDIGKAGAFLRESPVRMETPQGERLAASIDALNTLLIFDAASGQ